MPPPRRVRVNQELSEEALHTLLNRLTTLADQVVVIFDEFQQLHYCPGNPLSIIRSALLGVHSGNTSLMMTGSIRESLELMFTDKTEPLYGEAKSLELPRIDYVQFAEYLDKSFQATNKPASEEALEMILSFTDLHPNRTQQLAWEVWNAARKPNLPLTAHFVEDTYQRMLEGVSLNLEFDSTLNALVEDNTDLNEQRALFVLADQNVDAITGQDTATLYGFKSRSLVMGAIKRLYKRGLVHQHAGTWKVSDPFFSAWLKTRSPFKE